MSKQMECIVSSIQKTTVPEVIVVTGIGGTFGLLGGALVGTLTAIQSPAETISRMAIGAVIGTPVGAVALNVLLIKERTDECMSK